MTMEFTHECKVCKKDYQDDWEVQFICVDCDNEFSEWMDDNGIPVDWGDRQSPNFQPDALKGTKWEHMND